MRTIVVGVDGSAESRNALSWAIEEAAVRDARVEAVYAYDHTPAWYAYGYGGAGDDPDRVAQREARLQERATREDASAQQRAEALVRSTVDAVATDPAVPVVPVAVADRRPAHALIERSRDALLLVVGSRGRGGFAGLVLGSVSQQCAQHAACPVVIHSATNDATST